MRSIVCTAFGTEDNFVVEEGPTPDPAPGQVRVAVKAAGASFVDALQAAGKYQFAAQPPYVPGGEAAGVIDALGDGVEGWAVGDRVFISMGKGAFADRAFVAPQQLTRLPDEIDLAVGASFMQVYGTAWFAFTSGRSCAPARSSSSPVPAGAWGSRRSTWPARSAHG